MIIGVLICLAAMFGLQWIFPAWWWIMVVPFLWCLWKANSGWRGFLVGMLSAGILWLGGSLFYLSTSGEIIAQRVEAATSVTMIILITVLIAAVAGGVAGCTGGLLRAAFRPGRR